MTCNVNAGGLTKGTEGTGSVLSRDLHRVVSRVVFSHVTQLYAGIGYLPHAPCVGGHGKEVAARKDGYHLLPLSMAVPLNVSQRLVVTQDKHLLPLSMVVPLNVSQRLVVTQDKHAGNGDRRATQMYCSPPSCCWTLAHVALSLLVTEV